MNNPALPESVDEPADIIRKIADHELPPRFACHTGSRKTDGSLVTEADVIMQSDLIDGLRQHWPGIDILGEEMTQDEQLSALQNQETGVWCIDPLDGTSNFSIGVPYYAVSVALLFRGQVEMGIVYDPSRKECFTASRGKGAWLNDQPLRQQPVVKPLSDCTAMIDLKRLPADLASRLAADPPYKSQRSFGAVALDWCWLAAGRCHVYLHGKQKLWDYAAGHLILQETGGLAVTLEGQPVFAPRLEPRSTAAALHPEIFHAWLDWLGISRRDVA